MARNKINRTTVIAVSDIDDDSARKEFREYMLDTLKSKTRTESVYEFVFDSVDKKWKDIITRIKEIINEKKILYTFGM